MWKVVLPGKIIQGVIKKFYKLYKQKNKSHTSQMCVSLCTSGLLLTWTFRSLGAVFWPLCGLCNFFAHQNLNFCVKLTNLFGWTSSLVMRWVSSCKKMWYIRSQPTPGACFSLFFPVLTHLREKNMVYLNIPTQSALKTVLLAIPMQTLYDTS